jgi:ABC-type transport system involved in multi-copper enzyme maturation permease subunit
LYFECGCTAGAYALLVTLALAPVAGWLTWPYPFTHTIAALSIWFLIVIGCTLAAKMLAQIMAHFSLKRSITALERREGVVGAAHF